MTLTRKNQKLLQSKITVKIVIPKYINKMEEKSKVKCEEQKEDQNQEFTYCSKQNVWSQLQNVFTKYEDVFVGKVKVIAFKEQGIIRQIQCQSDVNNEVRQIFAEFKKKVQQKMSLILFGSQVSQIQVIKMKKQLEKSKGQIRFCQVTNQAQRQQMQSKLEKMEILVKTYERSLINKGPKKIVDQYITLQNDADNVLKIKKHLLINHTVNVCIQNGQNLAQNKILQFSKLNQSRIFAIKENINGERPVLREMEQNWNKSINLSSKRVKSNDKELLKSVHKDLKKSAHKGHTNLIQRQEKLKGQSQIGHKNFSQSSINQSKHSAKQNISSQFSKTKHYDREQVGEKSSTISQFVINKVEMLKQI